VAAAVRRFAVDGFYRTSVADVARDVGLTPTAVYRYFPDKDSLFVAAVDADTSALVDLARESFFSFPGGQPIGRFMSDMVGSMVDAVRDHPLAGRVLTGAEPMTPERILELPRLAEMRSQITSLLQLGQRVGMVRTDVEPSILALGIETIFLYQLAHFALLHRAGVAAPADNERWMAVAKVLESAVMPCPPPRTRGTP
jgi:AcrR family transcriptional regulator